MTTPSAHSAMHTLEKQLRELGLKGARELIRKGSLLGAVATVGTVATQPAIAQNGTRETTANTQNRKSQSNKDMVVYNGGSWVEHEQCNSRGGCRFSTLFVKILVQPVAAANLAEKKVGIGFSFLGQDGWNNAEGRYFTTLDSGLEEWHIPVRIDNWSMNSGRVIRFAPWYHDGLGNEYYNDNNGNLFVDATGTSPTYYVYSYDKQLSINGNRLQGYIKATLADLAYEKDVRLVYSTDGWKTTHEIGMNTGAINGWHWAQDLYRGYEEWVLDLDLDIGDAREVDYAILYRHAPKSGTPRDFWDNNWGQNYSVIRN